MLVTFACYFQLKAQCVDGCENNRSQNNKSLVDQETPWKENDVKIISKS